MARARNIKPSFFTNEVLGQMDPIACLLFIGLWTIADKDGILEDRPLRIKAEVFPYRKKLDVNRYLTELERCDFILRYEANGSRFIYIKNFVKHQHPHVTEKPKGFPQPPAISCKQVQTTLTNGCSTSDLLNTDLLNTDSNNTAKAVKFSASTCLTSKGVSESVAKDWIDLRKLKRAAVTETAIKGIENEAIKAGLSLEDALRMCCQRGWQGFKAEWVKEKVNESHTDKLEQSTSELIGRNKAMPTFTAYAERVD